MSAIVCRERAKATWLTGAVGLLLLMAAFVMMLVGAPTQLHHPERGPAKPPAVRLTTDLCHQLMLIGDVTGRPPRTFRQWAQANASAF